MTAPFALIATRWQVEMLRSALAACLAELQAVDNGGSNLSTRATCIGTAQAVLANIHPQEGRTP